MPGLPRDQVSVYPDKPCKGLAGSWLPVHSARAPAGILPTVARPPQDELGTQGREAREQLSHRTSEPPGPPPAERESLEATALVKTLWTSQGQRSASERPGRVLGLRALENLHCPGSAGGDPPLVSAVPTAARALSHAPSRRGEPPPARPPRPRRTERGGGAPQPASIRGSPGCRGEPGWGGDAGRAGQAEGADRAACRESLLGAAHARLHLCGV